MAVGDVANYAVTRIGRLTEGVDRKASPGEPPSAADLSPAADQTPPGAYLAVFTEGLDADLVSIEARRMGLQLRDTFLVVGPERIGFVLLLRRPSGRTILEDAELGRGLLNVNACRVGDYTNPNAFEGYERTSQVGNWGMKASRGRQGEASADRRYAESGGTDFALTPGVRGGDPNGRWPGNVALIEGALARHLDEARGDAGAVSMFYARFASMDELKAWIEKLLAAPRLDAAVELGAPRTSTA